MRSGLRIDIIALTMLFLYVGMLWLKNIGGVMKGICDWCSMSKNEVHVNRQTGMTTCRNCYQKKRRISCTRCKAIGRICFNDGLEKLCPRCYANDPILSHAVCFICGELRQVHTRKDKKTYCQQCVRSDPENHEACVDCGRVQRVFARLDRGPQCSRCHQKDPDFFERCVVCLKLRAVFSRRDKQPVCQKCHRRVKQK